MSTQSRSSKSNAVEKRSYCLEAGLGRRRTASQQQFLATRVFHFEIVCGQLPKLFEEGLPDAKPQELGFDGGHEFVTLQSFSPSLQNGELFWLTTQIVRGARQENVQEITDGDILLQIGRVLRFANQAVADFGTDRVVRDFAGRVPAEIVNGTAHDVFEMVKKSIRAVKMACFYRTPGSMPRDSGLDSENGRVDYLFSSNPGQVPSQFWLGPKISQQILSKLCELVPLFGRYLLESLEDIRRAHPCVQTPPCFRCFCFHVREIEFGGILERKY
jgi:hypothetical protein